MDMSIDQVKVEFTSTLSSDVTLFSLSTSGHVKSKLATLKPNSTRALSIHRVLGVLAIKGREQEGDELTTFFLPFGTLSTGEIKQIKFTGKSGEKGAQRRDSHNANVLTIDLSTSSSLAVKASPQDSFDSKQGIEDQLRFYF